MSSEAELDISTWKRSILLVKMLKSHTAGMATKRPRAVVTSASAIPVETAAIPPDPVIAIPHVRGRHQGFPLDGPLRRFDRVVPLDVRAAARDVVLKLVQPRRDDPRQVALLVLLGGVDGLLKLVLLQMQRHQLG